MQKLTFLFLTFKDRNETLTKMSFDSENFKSNPNFKFKEIVVEKTECLASTYQFDCYKADDGETYLISPYWDIERADKPDHHISL